ncbi:MAG: DsbA family protein [Nannocystales bacterium]
MVRGAYVSFGLSLVLLAACRPAKSDANSLESRLTAMEQEHQALVAQLELVEAEQRAMQADADTAAIERRRARGVTDDLSTRVTDLEVDKRPAPSKKAQQGRPDPAARYAATVGDAQTKGPSDALVTIVMFEDFQCPYCSRAADTMDKVVKEYGQDVRLVFKHNPLAFHQAAMPAAMASEAAGRQGKFWKMHDLLFDNQKQLEEKDLLRYAKKLRLNRKQFKRDLRDQGLKQKIKDQQAQSQKLGARGTPAFFVNGRFLSGARPFDSFAELIDEELAHARAMVDGGTPRAQVYDALMQTALPGV